MHATQARDPCTTARAHARRAGLDGPGEHDAVVLAVRGNRLGGGADAVADLDSFDSDGWTLNYSDGSASARKMLAFAIGDSTAGGGAPTLSDLKAASITATTVQGTYDYAF